MSETSTAPVAPAWIKVLPLLVLAGLCAYANSFNGLFFFDDDTWIVNNARIGDLVGFVQYWPSRAVVAASISFNYLTGGMSAPGFHAFNLAVHLAAGLTLFGLLRRTLLLPRWNGRFAESAPWLAFAATLFWVVHPLQTQSVTYIIQRCESLMGLFYLLLFYCLLRASESRRPWGWCVGAWLAFYLGMRCKEVMLTAPVLAVIYDRMFLADSWKELLQRRGIFHLGLWVQLGVGAFDNLGRASAGDEKVGFHNTSITPLEYFMTQAEVIFFYLYLSVWPVAQCLDYFDWPVTRDFRDAVVPVTLLVLLGLGTLWGLWRRHWLAFLAAWFYVILSPTSSIVPIVDLVFEHRMYLSLAAVSVALVAAGAWLSGTLARYWQWPPGLLQGVRIAAVVAVAGFLGLQTFKRNQMYLDRVSFWEDVYEKRPRNVRAAINLGGALHGANRSAEALEVFKKGLELEPHPFLTMGLGTVYMSQHEFEKSEPLLLEALRLAANQVRVPINLAMLYVKTGQWNKAAHYFDRARRLTPTDGLLHFRLAAALEESGQIDDARVVFTKARELMPDWPAGIQLVARQMLFDPDNRATPYLLDALFCARQACEGGTSDQPGHYDSLGLALAALGRLPEAAAAARQGLALAEARGDADWARILRQRLGYYDRGQPVPLTTQ